MVLTETAGIFKLTTMQTMREILDEMKPHFTKPVRDKRVVTDNPRPIIKRKKYPDRKYDANGNHICLRCDTTDLKTGSRYCLECSKTRRYWNEKCANYYKNKL